MRGESNTTQRRQTWSCRHLTSHSQKLWTQPNSQTWVNRCKRRWFLQAMPVAKNMLKQAQQRKNFIDLYSVLPVWIYWLDLCQSQSLILKIALLQRIAKQRLKDKKNLKLTPVPFLSKIWNLLKRSSWTRLIIIWARFVIRFANLRNKMWNAKQLLYPSVNLVWTRYSELTIDFKIYTQYKNTDLNNI